MLGMFFFKRKTAYELRISDWSSDVCSSDLPVDRAHRAVELDPEGRLLARIGERETGAGEDVRLEALDRLLEHRDVHRRDVPLALQTELIDFGLLGSGEARTRDEVRNAQTARNDRGQIRCERTAVARQVDRARLDARRIGSIDRKSTRLHSRHSCSNRMPFSA